MSKLKTGKHPKGADFIQQQAGGITLLTPLTPRAREWIGANVDRETALWYGGALAIEPRYMGPIADAIGDAGLSVRG